MTIMMKFKSVLKNSLALTRQRQNLFLPTQTTFQCILQARGLSELITPELTETLAGKFTRKKFKLLAIEDDLRFFERENFPLPESLSLDQWQQLMQLENRVFRNKYFDLMFAENEMQPLTNQQFEDLLEADKKFVGTLRIDQEMIDSIDTGISDERKAEVIEVIQRIHEEMLQDGHRVWAEIPLAQWEQFMDPAYELSHRAVSKTMNFLNLTLEQQLTDLVKKRARQSKKDEGKKIHQKLIADNEHIHYGLGHNQIHLRVNDRVLIQQDDWKVIREYHSWGQPLVIDLSFLKSMTPQAAMSLMDRELPIGLKINRIMREPMPVYITSYDEKCHKCRMLEKGLMRVKNESKAELPFHLTSQHFTELFPKERLLILSPDSRNDLMKYDPDDIYVIGGIVERKDRQKHTLHYARHNEIRHARFPMKRTVGMHQEVNVDTAMAIISDFKNNKDWFQAFRWVPPRKFKATLTGHSYTPVMEATYLAQHALSPNLLAQDFPTYNMIKWTPKQYSEAYRKIFNGALEGVKHPHKHIPNEKYTSMTKIQSDRYTRKEESNAPIAPHERPQKSKREDKFSSL